MNDKPILGISGCLTGAAVRFDGGHKRMGFIMDELADWVTFKPVCPEMGIGLPTPRPALRLVKTANGDTRVRMNQDLDNDLTDKMHHFAEEVLPGAAHFAGFIVCAKSPSCGM